MVLSRGKGFWFYLRGGGRYGSMLGANIIVMKD